MAASGEVEDNQWFFGPTAITLVNATTGSQETSLIIVLGLTAVALLVTTLYIGRRQERLSGK
jgi:LPXTG-motif cell wall-anchored protein